MGVLFDADTDQVLYGDVTFLDGLGTVTISWWAKVDSVVNAARNWISKAGASFGNGSLLIKQEAADGTMLTCAAIGTSGSTFSVGQETGLVATGSTWKHYCATWTTTPDTWTVYINGVDQAVPNSGTAMTTIQNQSGVFTLGDPGGSELSILGSLAEVAIWNRVLVANEITGLVAGYTPDFMDSGLLYYAPLAGDTVSRVGPQPTGTTGITFTNHPPMIRRTSGTFVAAVSTFTTGLGGRRTFAGLGTRTGSRQPQEV